MSRIGERFAHLKGQNRTALIPYITAGDPHPRHTVDFMHTLVAAGADLLELGVPFSDPMADGPVIQQASERALAHHVSLRQVLDMVRTFRKADASTPVVLMGYLNPIEVMGYETFARDAAAAGVDGVLTVDLPPEEADAWLAAAKVHKLDSIFLFAPTSTDGRIERLARAGGGFAYYVSLRGVTGAKNLDTAEVRAKVEAIRRRTTLPIGVGFGIKDAAAARAVAAFADAVIVGSAVVGRMAKLAATPERIGDEIGAFVRELRAALDSTKPAKREARA